ncbi:MAG TPA: HAD family acid phosphatase [Xanthobacteraceae bacterium]|nr:HAD family acid phosphatase [Xanthobacteraceae bacterium]
MAILRGFRWTAGQGFPAGAIVLAALLAPAVVHAARCDKSYQPSHQVLEQTQPLNIGQLKRQVMDYVCAGDYDRDIAKVLADAKSFIEQRAGAVKKPALVLDIDETSLSNWVELRADDFGYIANGPCILARQAGCGDRSWELLARAEAIRPTVELVEAAKGKGVAVFFITGRNGDRALRGATERNLRRAGYRGWTRLIMRDTASRKLYADEYKTRERAKIEAEGYIIIASVGDQESDLKGGHAERTFRVPNPFYLIPSKP